MTRLRERCWACSSRLPDAIGGLTLFGSLTLGSLVLGSLMLGGCRETPLDLIWADEPAGGDAGGSGGTFGSGGGSSGGQASGGSGLGGQAGGPPVEPCDGGSEDRYVIRHLAADLCLQNGPPTTVAREPAQEVALEACDGSVEQVWFVRLRPGGWEVQHLTTAANLDIRFASAEDGTIAVLFDPHQLYNQRFLVRENATDMAPLEGGARWILPRHAEAKCLAYLPTAPLGEQVQIWPCEDVATEQQWQFTAVTCPQGPGAN